MSADPTPEGVASRDLSAAPSESVSPQRRRLLRGLLDDLWSGLEPQVTQHLVTAAVELPLAHGPVLLGADAEGMPHLYVPVSSRHQRQVLLRTQGLSFEVRPLVVGERPQVFVDVACRRLGLIRVFLSLASEICAELAADGTTPLATTRRVVTDWRALFGAGATAWTAARTAGTFAEVVLLRRLLERHPSAASTWTGPSGAAQDFRAAGQAIEVKATLGPERRLVTVHGWDQLDAPTGSSLHLVWFRLLEDQTGMSLREALAEAVALSGKDPELISTVAGLTLPEAPHPEVDERRFRVQEELVLVVDDAFPKVVPSAFIGGAVPAGVIDLQYTVDLDTVLISSQVPELGPVLDGLAASA